MTLKRPLLMQAGGGDATFDYSALDVRALLGMLLRNAGVLQALSPGTSALQVTQRAAGANFSVDVAAGAAVIAGGDVSGQGMYTVESTAVENRVVPSPPVSGTRVHRVIAQVKDKLHNGALPANTYEWTLEVLEDTGSGTPAVPASAISLATVSVAAAQASVLNANITDTRAVALLGPSRASNVTAATRTLNPTTGEFVYRSDLQDWEVWSGSAWRGAGLNRPAARLGRTGTNQSIPTGFTSTLQWNTEFEDTHNGHDNVTNNSRYVAPISGLYLVTATAPWQLNSTGLREVSLMTNGATIYDGNRIAAISGIVLTQSVSHLVRLAAGEYVETVVFQNSGVSLDIDRTWHSGPVMEVVWMRP